MVRGGVCTFFNDQRCAHFNGGRKREERNAPSAAVLIHLLLSFALTPPCASLCRICLIRWILFFLQKNFSSVSSLQLRTIHLTVVSLMQAELFAILLSHGCWRGGRTVNRTTSQFVAANCSLAFEDALATSRRGEEKGKKRGVCWEGFERWKNIRIQHAESSHIHSDAAC